MNTDEHDELWRLLGKAKKSEVSPFFARNILRECRTRKHQQHNLFAWLLRKWRLALLTCSAVALLGVGFAPALFRKPAATPPALAQQQVPADYEAINHLDELLAYEENSIWLDNSSY